MIAVYGGAEHREHRARFPSAEWQSGMRHDIAIQQRRTAAQEQEQQYREEAAAEVAAADRRVRHSREKQLREQITE